MYPHRQTTPSALASARSRFSASRTRNPTPVMPSSAALRRALSTIAGEKSLEMTVPRGETRSATRKPRVAGVGGDLEDRLARLRVERVYEVAADVCRGVQMGSRHLSQPGAIRSQVVKICAARSSGI
jgi:hypothetical protein